MFNTTCRIDANGYMVQRVIQEDLSKICEELRSNKSCSQLNDKIKQMCKLTKNQINNPKKGQTKAILYQMCKLNPTTELMKDKAKQKRTKKKDNLEQTNLELQLTECKVKISNLLTVDQEYSQTIELLSSKLCIQSPLDNSSQHPSNHQIHQLEMKFEGQINNLKMNFEHQLNIMSLQMKYNTEVNELKCKLYHMENECNKYKTPASGNQQLPSQYAQMNTRFAPFPGSQNGNFTQQTLNHPQTPGVQWTRPPIWIRPPPYQAHMGLVFTPYAHYVQQQKTHSSHDTRPKNNLPTRQRVNTEKQGQNRARMQRANQKQTKTQN
ncbi:unnamed protein product [Mytilus coruscus]|uniref:Uncharacterized protein n=1 Tax=Mytilus coruscus TaxID=42192 RepID=A0A6J8EZ08_MYTCO|nr:unnamed protein product [Mytilus coruscus]